MNEKRIVSLISLVICSPLIYWLFFAHSGSDSHYDDPQWHAQHAEYEARAACETRIKGLLKAPATAQFSNESAVNHGDGRYTVTTSVDAQNSFGALLRQSFTCEAVTQDGISFSTVALGAAR